MREAAARVGQRAHARARGQGRGGLGGRERGRDGPARQVGRRQERRAWREREGQQRVHVPVADAQQRVDVAPEAVDVARAAHGHVAPAPPPPPHVRRERVREAVRGRR